MRFHHTAFRIHRGTLKTAERLFYHFDFETLATSITETDAAIWMGPKDSVGVIQLNEVDA
ncbi:hypothetical protein HY632_03075 [Candidatus Uhrbacteria bacterium]|nr:hypothetical protein [Candidatus Uhrbacteria bacterium]